MPFDPFCAPGWLPHNTTMGGAVATSPRAAHFGKTPCQSAARPLG